MAGFHTTNLGGGALQVFLKQREKERWGLGFDKVTEKLGSDWVVL